MSFFSRVALCALMLCVVASSASAQHHPVPSPTVVPCTTCLPPNKNRLIQPYPTLIKNFRGRFVDSTDVKDWPGPPPAPRTIRARGTIIVPQLDRIYMMLGSGVASYRLSTFFSTRISQPMTTLAGYPNLPRFLGDTEKWLVPDAYWYAEMVGSGWDARTGDGQDRLYDLDADDRGYVYPACGPLGWGVLNGNTELTNVSQRRDPIDDLSAGNIISLRSGSQYYVLVSDFISQERALIFDVTNPSTLIKVLKTDFAPYWSWAKVTTPTGNNILGALDSVGNAYIYTVDGLLNGTGPARKFPGTFNFITSDGTNFHATVKGSLGTVMKISTFSPSVVGDAATYSESIFDTGESFAPDRIRYGRGYLTIQGRSAGRHDVRIYRMEGANLVKVDVGDYFTRFYVPLPSTDYVGAMPYVNPTDAITYTDGSRDHIIFSAHGVGDVYELSGSGVPPPPSAPDPNVIISGCARLKDPCSMTARSLSGASEAGWSCSWTFGGFAFDDATKSCTIQPVFNASGAFAVGVSVTNALGTGAATTSLTVGPEGPAVDPNCAAPPSQVSVSLQGLSSTCNNVNAACAAGEAVTFFPSAFGGSFKACDQFAWSFGDGTSATGRTVTHAFSSNGVYTVRLTVSNPAGSSTATPATVTIGSGGGGGNSSCNTPPPNNVSVNLAGTSPTCNNVNASCPAGETVTFFPSAFGASFRDCDQFAWTFGDGGSSTGRNVTHAFSSNGVYVVRLTVSNSAGSSIATPATVTIGGGQAPCPAPVRFVSVNLIGISPLCNVSAGAICAPDEAINFSISLDLGGALNDCDNVSWDFGDGTTSTLRRPVKQYATTGAFRVQFTISNSTGATVSSPQVVTVAAGSGAKPILDNLFLPAMIVAGTDAKFTADTSAPAITRSDWIFGDGTGIFISQGLSATHKYAVAGSYDIKVTVTNVFGTSDVMTINITVRPPPPPPTTRKRGSKR